MQWLAAVLAVVLSLLPSCASCTRRTYTTSQDFTATSSGTVDLSSTHSTSQESSITSTLSNSREVTATFSASRDPSQSRSLVASVERTQSMTDSNVRSRSQSTLVASSISSSNVMPSHDSSLSLTESWEVSASQTTTPSRSALPSQEQSDSASRSIDGSASNSLSIALSATRTASFTTPTTVPTAESTATRSLSVDGGSRSLSAASTGATPSRTVMVIATSSTSLRVSREVSATSSGRTASQQWTASATGTSASLSFEQSGTASVTLSASCSREISTSATTVTRLIQLTSSVTRSEEVSLSRSRATGSLQYSGSHTLTTQSHTFEATRSSSRTKGSGSTTPVYSHSTTQSGSSSGTQPLSSEASQTVTLSPSQTSLTHPPTQTPRSLTNTSSHSEEQSRSASASQSRSSFHSCSSSHGASTSRTLSGSSSTTLSSSVSKSPTRSESSTATSTASDSQSRTASQSNPITMSLSMSQSMTTDLSASRSSSESHTLISSRTVTSLRSLSTSYELSSSHSVSISSAETISRTVTPSLSPSVSANPSQSHSGSMSSTAIPTWESLSASLSMSSVPSSSASFTVQVGTVTAVVTDTSALTVSAHNVSRSSLLSLSTSRTLSATDCPTATRTTSLGTSTMSVTNSSSPSVSISSSTLASSSVTPSVGVSFTNASSRSWSLTVTLSAKMPSESEPMSPSATVSLSLTASATMSTTPSNSSSPSVGSATVARSSSLSVSLVMSATFTATQSNELSSTASASQRPSFSITLTTTRTVSTSLSVAPSRSVSTTRSTTRTASNTTSPTLSESHTIRTASAQQSVTNSATESSNVTGSETSTISVSSTVTLTNTTAVTVSSDGSATHALSVSGNLSVTNSTSDTGSHSVSPSWSQSRSSSSSLTVSQTDSEDTSSSISHSVSATVSHSPSHSWTASVSMNSSLTVSQSQSESSTDSLSSTPSRSLTITIDPCNTTFRDNSSAFIRHVTVLNDNPRGVKSPGSSVFYSVDRVQFAIEKTLRVQVGFNTFLRNYFLNTSFAWFPLPHAEKCFVGGFELVNATDFIFVVTYDPTLSRSLRLAESYVCNITFPTDIFQCQLLTNQTFNFSLTVDVGPTPRIVGSEAYAITSAVSGALSFVVGATAMLQQSRADSLSIFATCQFSFVEQQDISNSPTQLGFGSEMQYYTRGCCVGNLAVIFGLMLLVAMCFGVVSLFWRKSVEVRLVGGPPLSQRDVNKYAGRWRKHLLKKQQRCQGFLPSLGGLMEGLPDINQGNDALSFSLDLGAVARGSSAGKKGANESAFVRDDGVKRSNTIVGHGSDDTDDTGSSVDPFGGSDSTFSDILDADTTFDVDQLGDDRPKNKKTKKSKMNAASKPSNDALRDEFLESLGMRNTEDFSPPSSSSEASLDLLSYLPKGVIRKETFDEAFQRVCGLFGFPASGLMPALLVVDSSVSSAVSLLVHPYDDFDRAIGGVTLGFFVFVLCVAVYVTVFYVQRDQERTRLPKAHVLAQQESWWVRAGRYWLVPPYEFPSKRRRDRTTYELLAPLFQDSKYAPFVCVDLSLSIAMAALVGVGISERDVCLKLAIVSFVLFGAFAAGVIYVRPSVNRLSRLTSVANSLLGLCTATCTMVSMAADVEVLAQVSQVLALLILVVSLINVISVVLGAWIWVRTIRLSFVALNAPDQIALRRPRIVMKIAEGVDSDAVESGSSSSEEEELEELSPEIVERDRLKRLGFNSKDEEERCLAIPVGNTEYVGTTPMFDDDGTRSVHSLFQDSIGIRDSRNDITSDELRRYAYLHDAFWASDGHAKPSESKTDEPTDADLLLSSPPLTASAVILRLHSEDDESIVDSEAIFRELNIL